MGEYFANNIPYHCQNKLVVYTLTKQQINK